MKLSVLNYTSRQGRVSSLTATKKADEDFYDPKYPILKKAATRSCQIFDGGEVIYGRPLRDEGALRYVSQYKAANRGVRS